MKIKLSDIKSGFQDRLFDIPASSIPNRGTNFKDNSIRCTLSSFVFKDNKYSLKGFIDTIISYECVRCLDAFESKICLPLLFASITKYLCSLNTKNTRHDKDPQVCKP